VRVISYAMRLKPFLYAIAGVVAAVKGERNMRIHVVAAVAAISTGLVYEQLKNIVAPKVIAGVAVADETWKVGVSIVPMLVCLMCIVGFIIAGKMPASYTEEIVSGELKRVEK